MARHLWDGQYGATTAHEYWAEGTQFWFNSNKLAVIDGKSILSDADLSRHDHALAASLKAVYGDRHRLPCAPFYRHTARVPDGPPSRSTDQTSCTPCSLPGSRSEHPPVGQDLVSPVRIP